MDLTNPGFWLFLAGLEILLLFHIAEFVYPGYSVSKNYISDLGVGPQPSRAIFTIAVILFGVLALVAAFYMHDRDPSSYLWVLIVIAAIGSIGVGLFNERSVMVNGIPVVHYISAILAFGFGNIAAIYSYSVVAAPFSYICVALGVVGFGALVYVGLLPMLTKRRSKEPRLGIGGVERMTFYPAMFWLLGFGAYLMASAALP
jgi:hypothetical membrane protein